MTQPLPEQATPDPATYDQQGAICWRLKRGKVQVLLITSRDTGRWIIPKGWPIAGKSFPESAKQESWEEAGVEGPVTETALGAYRYEKLRRNHTALPCVVRVFGIRVERLAETFPEHHQRRRKWFNAAKAARKVNEPELSALLHRLADAPTDLLADTVDLPQVAVNA